MGGLSSLAIRSLRARRGRTGLSIIGIALGIAVLYASLATDAGISASIDRTVRDLVGRADLRIEAFGPTGLSPASLAAIEEAPGVALAAPGLERRTFLLPLRWGWRGRPDHGSRHRPGARGSRPGSCSRVRCLPHWT